MGVGRTALARWSRVSGPALSPKVIRSGRLRGSVVSCSVTALFLERHCFALLCFALLCSALSARLPISFYLSCRSRMRGNFAIVNCSSALDTSACTTLHVACWLECLPTLHTCRAICTCVHDTLSHACLPAPGLVFLRHDARVPSPFVHHLRSYPSIYPSTYISPFSLPALHPSGTDVISHGRIRATACGSVQLALAQGRKRKEKN